MPAPEGSLNLDCSLVAGSQVLSLLPASPCCLYLDAALPLLLQLQEHANALAGLCTADDSALVISLMCSSS